MAASIGSVSAALSFFKTSIALKEISLNEYFISKYAAFLRYHQKNHLILQINELWQFFSAVNEIEKIYLSEFESKNSNNEMKKIDIYLSSDSDSLTRNLKYTVEYFW